MKHLHQVVLLSICFIIIVDSASSPLPTSLPMETARGPCPRPRTITNFHPEKLSGTWYDVKRYKNTITKGSCGSVVYHWYPNNNTYTVPYKMLEFPTNVLTLNPIDLNSGKFFTGVNGMPTPFDYWLIDVDYDHYHIAYTCIELVPRLVNSQSVNIYSRHPSLDPQHLSAAIRTVSNNNLDTSILVNVVQDSRTCRRG